MTTEHININFDVQTLVSVVNQEKYYKPAMFLAKKFFPLGNVSYGLRATVEKTNKTARIAPYINPDIAVTPIQKDTRSLTDHPIPNVGPMVELNYKDFFARQAGVARGLSTDPRTGNIFQEKIAEETAKLVEIIQRTIEYRAAGVLLTGTLVVSGEGISYTIDFGRNANNAVTLSGDDLFTADTANPIMLLDKIADQISRDNGGLRPTEVIFGPGAAFQAFVNNPNVIAKLDLRRGNFGNFEPRRVEPKVVYLGEAMGLNYWKYTEYDVDGSPLIPATSCVLDSEGNGNHLHYGAITDNDIIKQYNGAIALPYFVKSWNQQNPNKDCLQVLSSPFIAQHEPDSTGVVQVVAS